MKKALIVACAVIGAAVLAKRAKSMCAHADFGKMIERMPDDAPPKWMFRNVSAIRANTDRILELLSREPAGSTETRAPAAA
jgi:hypothetical protein